MVLFLFTIAQYEAFGFMLLLKLALGALTQHRSVYAALGVPVGGDISSVAPFKGTEGAAYQFVLQPQQVEEERLFCRCFSS